MTSLSKYPHKYLYVVSLIFHLRETTILSKSTESNEIAFLTNKILFYQLLYLQILFF